MTLPEQIKSIRKSQGLTQKELAERAGISNWYMCLIEKGLKYSPSISTLTKIACALGCELVINFERKELK